MPSMEEVEKFLTSLCAERSENIARLNEQKDTLTMKTKRVEQALEDQHAQLRAANNMMEVCIAYRESLHAVSNTETDQDIPFPSQVAPSETAQEKFERLSGIDTLGMPGRNSGR